MKKCSILLLLLAMLLTGCTAPEQPAEATPTPTQAATQSPTPTEAPTPVPTPVQTEAPTPVPTLVQTEAPTPKEAQAAGAVSGAGNAAGNASSGASASGKAAKNASEKQSVTVYITKTGSKYHRSGCRYLSKSKIPISLEDARGAYSPCSVCNPG